jgi:hypothetical protein
MVWVVKWDDVQRHRQMQVRVGEGNRMSDECVTMWSDFKKKKIDLHHLLDTG